MHKSTPQKIITYILSNTLIFVFVAALVIGCSEPQTQNTSQYPNQTHPAEDATKHISEVIVPEPQQVMHPSNNDFFVGLNNTIISDFCGLWQVYKRKPHDGPERFITENYYLDLKKDFTYNSNGWLIRDSGQFMPTFNYSNSGELMTFIIFTNTAYEKNLLTTVRAEIIEENGTKMLKISDLEDLSFDYYIRK